MRDTDQIFKNLRYINQVAATKFEPKLEAYYDSPETVTVKCGSQVSYISAEDFGAVSEKRVVELALASLAPPDDTNLE